jgi:hypothetical protein
MLTILIITFMGAAITLIVENTNRQYKEAVKEIE